MDLLRAVEELRAQSSEAEMAIESLRELITESGDWIRACEVQLQLSGLPVEKRH